MNKKLYCLEDQIGYVQLLRRHDDPALATVNAARCSYGGESGSYTDKDQKLSKYLWSNEHTSPFRHTFYTFQLKCPLFLFRQIVKYQVGSSWRTFEVDGQEVSFEVFEHMFDTDKGCSWNELSGRYKELEPEFYIPKTIRGPVKQGSKQAANEWEDSPAGNILIGDMEFEAQCSYEFYKCLLADGVAKEMARMFLPQNIYTTAQWTVSLQAVLHFLSQRLKPEAQYEIRKVAEAVKLLIKDDLDKLGVEI